MSSHPQLLRNSNAGVLADRRGVTLMELLLVLAVLVIVSAMAAPSVSRALEGQKLRKSADVIRSELARARVRAMKTGRMQMFRFQPGTANFEIRPWVSDDDANEASLAARQSPGGQNLPYQNPSLVSGQEIVTKLREGMTFYTLATSQASRDVLTERDVLSDPLAANQQASEDWSRPILLYPDGTSSDARLVLKNQREQFVMIQLRGLTGVAQVSGLLAAEELPQ